jgi:mannonate dehydratase
MYLGTQITPREDADYRMWAQLGVWHVCVDPPGNPHHWTLDDLNRHREHVESFGLTLDRVQLPLSSRPLEQSQSPNILLGREPDRQREIDSICALIERLAAAGIPAAKYNLNIIGSRGRPQSSDAAARAMPLSAGTKLIHRHRPVSPASSMRQRTGRGSSISSPARTVCASPAIRTIQRRPGYRGVTRVLGSV